MNQLLIYSLSPEIHMNLEGIYMDLRSDEGLTLETSA